MNARAAGLRNGDTSLDRKGGLYVEALRIVERRSVASIPNKIPVEPSPIEAEGIGDQHWLRRTGEGSNPARRLLHRNLRVLTCPKEPLPVQAVHPKGLGFVQIRNRLQLLIDAVRIARRATEFDPIKRTGEDDRER